MTNTEHLDWIYQRLVKVYHEDENMDYMHRLKKIIEETGEAEERADYLLGQCETVNNTNHELRAEIQQLTTTLSNYDKEYIKAGWRCCIDHLLKPEHPCPICKIEELRAMHVEWEAKIDEIKAKVIELKARKQQLESLLGRIHKATDQFYKKQEKPKVDNCPYSDILDLYHKILPELPKVVKLTDKRKAAMRQRWQSDLETRTDWALYFKDAASKPFFFGRNDRGWIADFDFFLREQTITYIQEGKYG